MSAAEGTPRRPLGGWATAATVLVLIVLLRETVVVVANWRAYELIHAYVNGTASVADLEAADNDALTAVSSSTLLMAVLWIATGGTFLVWLWRARINAESLGGRDMQRRTRIWVVGSWIAPVVNLWYPYQIVSDIWQASAPRRPAAGTLVKAWWACFVLAGLVKPIQWRLASQDWHSEGDALSNANVSLLLTVLIVAAGVLIILIIKRITAWQSQTPPTAGDGR
ncbi:DUF4328 domain-containing protein [Kitasatospora sp. NPDC092948]|uniref:DUF4328 domain-containing protein n=1 Tax=Kitasatospora sp. NPDC092948 TaxID=3364088 RepID=UPI00381AEA6A